MNNEPQTQPGVRTFRMALVARHVEGRLITQLVEPDVAAAVREQLQNAEPAVRATVVILPVTVSISELEIVTQMTKEFEGRNDLEAVFKWMRETN